MTTRKEVIDSILDDFPDLDREDISKRISLYVDQYNCPLDEANVVARNYFKVRSGDMSIDAEKRQVKDIRDMDEGEKVSLEVKVVDIEEDIDNDLISCSGVFADSTGSISFVAWNNSSCKNFSIGDAIEVINVRLENHFTGREISFNPDSRVEKIDKSIDPDIINKSRVVIQSLTDRCGLVNRCSEDGCDGVLSSADKNSGYQDGECRIHGNIASEKSVCFHGWVSDISKTAKVYFNRSVRICYLTAVFVSTLQRIHA
ncbi:MAG: hypothetical protein ABEK59_03370 [Halobacteria archaeon]